MQKLRQIHFTRILDCSMEEGLLRCDGNVSSRAARHRVRTKTGS